MPELQSLLAAAREFGELPETELYMVHAPIIRIGLRDHRRAEGALAELLSALVEQGKMLRLAVEELAEEENSWRRSNPSPRIQHVTLTNAEEVLADLRARAARNPTE
jgi:hypothetical protein